MTVEDDIRKFIEWGTRMGFPAEHIPSSEALRVVFTSPQRDVFCNLMRRVRPLDEVKTIRETVLIQAMNKWNNQIIPVSERFTLPKEMQIYLQNKDLQKTVKEAQNTLNENKKQYDELMTSIKTKCIEMMNIKNKFEKLEAKVMLYKRKLKELDDELRIEEETHNRISDNIPAIPIEQNNCKSIAEEAVYDAIEKLKSFYEYYDTELNQQILHESKQKLWEDMREIFRNIPNYNIFNTIISLNEKHDFIKQSGNDYSLQQDEINKALRWNILEKQAEIFNIIQKYVATCKERLTCEQELLRKYDEFEDKLLQNFINPSNLEINERENLMREYIVQYTRHHALKNGMIYLQKEAESAWKDYEATSDYLSNHELLLNLVKETYAKINETINRIQPEMEQLFQVKERITSTRNTAKKEFQDLKMKINASNKGVRSNLTRSFILNQTGTFSVNSHNLFDISNNSVLCSTKLDLDVTGISTKSMQSTIKSGVPSCKGGNLVVPRHSTELQVFSELNMDQCLTNTNECLMDFLLNPLIVGTNEHISSLILAPGILLTPNGVLQEVQKQIDWFEYIHNHTHVEKLKLDLKPVDTDALKIKEKEYNNRIDDFFHRIEYVLNKTNRSMEKNQKLYQFILTNPLRNCIPKEKEFGNRSYKDYEDEYMMFYRMLSADSYKNIDPKTD